jgi:uncharacterized protein
MPEHHDLPSAASDGSARLEMNNIAQSAALTFLRAYQWLISPLLPPACRYVPSCSEYALEAVARYGALRGAGMAIWRVLRCNPFVAGGYDPVVKSETYEVEPAQRGLCSH